MCRGLFALQSYPTDDNDCEQILKSLKHPTKRERSPASISNVQVDLLHFPASCLICHRWTVNPHADHEVGSQRGMHWGVDIIVTDWNWHVE